MWTLFQYKNGSNPYITKTNEELFRMICKYELEQINETAFEVVQERTNPIGNDYSDKRNVLREFAKQWQDDFSKFDYSLEDLASWQEFFTKYGCKFGLAHEFKANGIY